MTQSFDNEKNIYKYWQIKKLFTAKLNSKKPPYGLLMPPPNLTGELHIGHALQHSILDAIARFKRLQGFEVLLLPGVDHAGIQFEGTFDKYLQKQGLSKHAIGREQWLKKAWEFKKEVYDSVSKSWRLMGISADWSKEVFSLDPVAQKAVFEEFKTFFDQGLIYKGPYIVQWCPKCNTAIEDVEMEYEERVEKLYFLKYGPLTLATTRPETKFGDTAMAVNPKDKRYKDYIGKEFEIETLAGRKKMKVVADDAVDPKFGTGVIKVTPAHDFTDYEIGKRHNLPVVQVINKEGRLTEVAGKYAGMKVSEAREAMLPELKEKGILLKEEEYKHSVAICERSRNVVEPLISEEWFVKMGHLATVARKSLMAGEIEFLPTSFAKLIDDWLGNIHDWCISRSLWWGHRIPVWYPSTTLRTSPSTSLQQSSGQVADPSTHSKLSGQTSSGPGGMRVSLESPGEGWVQDEQVLDTWFSSGLWPLITLGWSFVADAPQDKLSKATGGLDPEMAKYFPWSFEISGPEIKYLWIARMIMLGLHFTGDVPFSKMFFHGTLRDLQGRKFSKSLGNGIDPNYLIDKWGVDATRMTLYSYSIPGRDGRVSKAILDERCKNFRNFATKIRNVSRFVLDLKPEGAKKSLEFNNADDIEVRSGLEILASKVANNLETFNLHLASEDLYNFVWHNFADDYIEKSKQRRDEAQPVLVFVLKNLMIMLHPFMPFLTEEIYQKFDERKESIVLESWPV